MSAVIFKEPELPMPKPATTMPEPDPVPLHWSAETVRNSWWVRFVTGVRATVHLTEGGERTGAKTECNSEDRIDSAVGYYLSSGHVAARVAGVIDTVMAKAIKREQIKFAGVSVGDKVELRVSELTIPKGTIGKVMRVDLPTYDDLEDDEPEFPVIAQFTWPVSSGDADDDGVFNVPLAFLEFKKVAA